MTRPADLCYPAAMTPAQILAAALVSGGPALQALVLGHLAAGRPGMAAVALCLPREALAALDAAFSEAKDEASAMAFLAAAFAAQQ